jgi:hypothetical protein
MTSLPIMWFAMYDYSFLKDDKLVEYVRLPFKDIDSTAEKNERDTH